MGLLALLFVLMMHVQGSSASKVLKPRRHWVTQEQLTDSQHEQKKISLGHRVPSWVTKISKKTGMARMFCDQSPGGCPFQYQYWFDKSTGLWMWRTSECHNDKCRVQTEDPSQYQSTLSKTTKSVIFAALIEANFDITPDHLRKKLLQSGKLQAHQLPPRLVREYVQRVKGNVDLPELPLHKKRMECYLHIVEDYCREHYATAEQIKAGPLHTLVVLTPPSVCVDYTTRSFRFVFTTKAMLLGAVKAAASGCLDIATDHKFKLCYQGIPLFVVGHLDKCQRFVPLAFQLAHSRTADALFDCFDEIQKAIFYVFGYYWRPVAGISDNDAAIRKLYREFFSSPLSWVNCYAHIAREFLPKYSKFAANEDTLPRMQGDLDSFHFGWLKHHADVLVVLFNDKWQPLQPEVLRHFSKGYLTDDNMTWLSLWNDGGHQLPKTNNGIENWNRQIADLLLDWTKMSLQGLLFNLKSGWILLISSDVHLRHWPVGPTDVLNPAVKPVKAFGCVSKKLKQRVRVVWIDAQGLASQPRKFLYTFQGNKYVLNDDYEQALTSKFKNQHLLAKLVATVRLCVPGWKKIVDDAASFVGPQRTAALTVLRSSAVVEILKLAGVQCDALSGFGLYVLVLSLFWIYDPANDRCTCRSFRHYDVCKHSLFFKMQEGQLSPPAKWNQTKVKTLNRKRGRDDSTYNDK